MKALRPILRSRISSSHTTSYKMLDRQTDRQLELGFTIIEVALVLAIAGLIFLVVFLALPALQRSQRDTARRQDVAKAVTAVTQFYADGGDPMSIPANPAFTGASSGLASGGGDLFPNVPVLGTYLQQAGVSSNIDRAKVWPYGHGCTSSWSQTVTGGLGSLELFVGCKCVSHNSSGFYTIALGTPYDTAVATMLESGSGSSQQNDYCVTASR